MNLERCPSCGLELAIGEAERHDGLCRICAGRKAAETAPQPSAGQDRLVTT